MPIQANISPRIIPSIASLYNDTNRILMEYIDNAIDSAESFINQEHDGYSKRIKISLTLDKDQVVTIEDNCSGITKFNKVIESIGNSDKKQQPWTNGQFGYGIYSFMAACSQLEITSKLSTESTAKNIVIEKKMFDADDQKDVVFDEPKNVQYQDSSGTTIIVSKFDKDRYKEINFNTIKNEIERHFELLLKRKNIEIKLIDATRQKKVEYVCQTFNYDDYEGETYKDTITDLSFIKGRKQPKKIKLSVPNSPVKIFLKITKGKVLNRPPIFAIKGRRVAEIKSINHFNSKHKSDIWGHPHITGYIDLSDFLEPTIARNDFTSNTHSKALFEKLLELEPLIQNVIKDVNEANEDKSYQALENKLNDALSQLAKLDALNYRKSYIKDKDGDTKLIEDEDGNPLFESSREGDNPTPDLTPNPDTETGRVTETESEFDDDKETKVIKGKETKKPGFNIKFTNGEPPEDEIIIDCVLN